MKNPSQDIVKCLRPVFRAETECMLLQSLETTAAVEQQGSEI